MRATSFRPSAWISAGVSVEVGVVADAGLVPGGAVRQRAIAGRAAARRQVVLLEEGAQAVERQSDLHGGLAVAGFERRACPCRQRRPAGAWPACRTRWPARRCCAAGWNCGSMRVVTIFGCTTPVSRLPSCWRWPGRSRRAAAPGGADRRGTGPASPAAASRCRRRSWPGCSGRCRSGSAAAGAPGSARGRAGPGFRRPGCRS
jgi:hypothetical protein